MNDRRVFLSTLEEIILDGAIELDINNIDTSVNIKGFWLPFDNDGSQITFYLSPMKEGVPFMDYILNYYNLMDAYSFYFNGKWNGTFPTVKITKTTAKANCSFVTRRNSDNVCSGSINYWNVTVTGTTASVNPYKDVSKTYYYYISLKDILFYTSSFRVSGHNQDGTTASIYVSGHNITYKIDRVSVDSGTYSYPIYYDPV